MSRPPYPTYPPQHPHHGRPFITVHQHDILCGRGVNIASHPGNERFRALVQTRHDANYCTLYTTSEKRAVAEEIVNHIKALDPPGRFLKRVGRAPTSRGLNGPWEELTDREAIKKTCQALRDCNRTDRQGYAATVEVPDDVRIHAASRSATGLTNKEQAAVAAAAKARSESVATVPSPSTIPPPQQMQPPHPQQRHPAAMAVHVPPGAVPLAYHPIAMHGVVPVPMPVPMMGMPMDISNGTYAAAPMPLPPQPPAQYQVPAHAAVPQQHQQHIPPPPHAFAINHHIHQPPPQPPTSTQHAAVAASPATPPEEQQRAVQVQQPFHGGHVVHPPVSALKRSRESFNDDNSISPSGDTAAHWTKKQKPAERRISSGTHTAQGISPANNDLVGGAPAFMHEMYAGYDIHAPTRTPSQETSTTSGTTPTTDGSALSRAHRPSISPASAMPPSPALAYDPLRSGAVSSTLYSFHDHMSPPAPNTAGHAYAFHAHQHQQHDHPVVSLNPSSEVKNTYAGSAHHIDQQQLQAAAELAAAAADTADEHGDSDYGSTSPNPYNPNDPYL